MIHIQSISDIITNSSSEVYTILEDDSIESVKKIIDSILALAGHGFHWDDFFKIEEDFDEDYALDLYKDDWNDQEHDEGEEYKDPTREELLDFVHNYNDANWDSGEGSLIETRISFAPIDPDAKESAALLHKLNDLFESQTQYC